MSGRLRKLGSGIVFLVLSLAVSSGCKKSAGLSAAPAPTEDKGRTDAEAENPSCKAGNDDPTPTPTPIPAPTPTTGPEVRAACDGTPHGSLSSRKRYLDDAPSSVDGCREETQQAFCSDGLLGSFTGSYSHESCSVQTDIRDDFVGSWSYCFDLGGQPVKYVYRVTAGAYDTFAAFEFHGSPNCDTPPLSKMTMKSQPTVVVPTEGSLNAERGGAIPGDLVFVLQIDSSASLNYFVDGKIIRLLLPGSSYARYDEFGVDHAQVVADFAADPEGYVPGPMSGMYKLVLEREAP